MTEPRSCPRCGAPVATAAHVGDLCPHCLVRLGMDTGVETEHTPFADGAPTQIGPYKILEALGEGGMGIVYVAEQQEPVHRKVALKIIKPGMDTKQVIARFEAERQALAMMEHPNIARVLDAGATDTGRPYFVMELVKGVSITEYCDKNNLSTKGRLDLFRRVCSAVQHAHQKGIIHRDIKPSNVMVTLQDGKPVPKVIDFGVAKATLQRLTERTLFTGRGVLIGTPAYMSPEQAEMSGLDVDTRTDIYSLGVLLYELLTGTTPFDVEALRRAGYAEIQRMIREEEPPKPSTRLSSLATEPRAPATGAPPSGSDSASLAEIARHRQTDPSTLSKLIRGDLDWIVMKALEKDRTRRYETANELAKDVEHHLANEPILAGPPGAAYRLRKFVRRNRVAVTAGSLVAAALVLGLLLSTIGFVQASRQRDRAIEAEQRALRAKQKARQQAYLANIGAANAALSMNEIATVRRRLDAAPEEFRNWEWQYIHARAENSLAVLRGHEAPVWRVAFSPDGTRLASWSWDKTVRLWDASTGEELAVLRGHGGPIASVAFSPDGTRLASVSAAWFDKTGDNTVRVWDAITGKELAVLRGHEGRVFSVAYSPDGTRLASGSEDKTVRLWDASTGEELAVLPGHMGFDPYGPVSISVGPGVAFSPDGTRLASWSAGGTMRFWDASTGKQLGVLPGEAGLLVAFNPDWTRVAWVPGWSLDKPSDYTVHVSDVITGEELAVLRGHKGNLTSVAFSPDGTRLASASHDKTVRVWDAFTLKELIVLRGHEHGVWSAVFSPDGTRLVSPSLDGTVRLWDASTGEELAVLRGHEDSVRYAEFSPDGTRLASSSEDSTVRLWDVYAGETLSVVRHQAFVESIAFSPDGTRLASGSADETVRLWDASTGDELAALRGHTGFVATVAFSPDGTRLASGSGSLDNTDNTVRVWNASTGEQLRVLQGHEAWVISVAFSPDGTHLASCSGSFDDTDNTVRVWNASTGEQLRVLQGHEAWVTSVAFSPDGTRLASGSSDGTVRLWDPTSGEGLAVLRGHEARVFSIAYSPDGTRLAVGSDDKTVRLWDATTGEELDVLRGHEAFVGPVAFSPDGTRLVSGSNDKTVRLWDASTGEELAVLRGHRATLRSVAFSPDGTLLASGSKDKTVRLWNAVPYRVLYQSRQATLAARPEAERIVDGLWQKLNDWEAVAQRLRADTSLSKPTRRAALNLVLRRATAHP